MGPSSLQVRPGITVKQIFIQWQWYSKIKPVTSPVLTVLVCSRPLEMCSFWQGSCCGHSYLDTRTMDQHSDVSYYLQKPSSQPGRETCEYLFPPIPQKQEHEHETLLQYVNDVVLKLTHMIATHQTPNIRLLQGLDHCVFQVIWLWLKKMVPKWHLGKWNQRLKLA